jgi:hypothetical protein
MNAYTDFTQVPSDRLGNTSYSAAELVQAWANHGYRIQYWRPGVEMNLVGSPDFVGDSYSLQQQWIAAFRHIYTTMHAAAASAGVKLYIVWNPGLVNGTPAGNATQTMWLGKQYVDIIGGDIYGEVTPRALYDWAATAQRSTRAF